MKFLKKNQIVISVIALMLITAGYFNYIDNIESIETMSNDISNSDKISAIGDAKLVDAEAEFDNTVYDEGIVENNVIESATQTDATKDSIENTHNIEEKQDNNIPEQNSSSNDKTQQDSIVLTSAEKVDDYFASTRLERNSMYSEMISSYESMIANPNVSETQKGIATNEIYSINTTKNAIMICENLIKNKGFEDVIVFSNNNSINVIVKASNLQTEQIAQIQNIISRELQAEVENIHISCK